MKFSKEKLTQKQIDKNNDFETFLLSHHKLIQMF